MADGFEKHTFVLKIRIVNQIFFRARAGGMGMGKELWLCKMSEGILVNTLLEKDGPKNIQENFKIKFYEFFIDSKSEGSEEETSDFDSALPAT